MIDEKWHMIVDNVKEHFDVEEEDTESLSLPDYEGDNAYAEYLIFTGPLGRMKVERTTMPRPLNSKTLYSKRIGGETAVTKQYDESELVQSFKAYKWDDDDEEWVELDGSKLSLG